MLTCGMARAGTPNFFIMLGLASAIASLGLLQNSSAVVIGSMLLAPLMTPMMGLGLALFQANVELMRLCGRSIGLGFLLTLGVSFLIGIVATPALPRHHRLVRLTRIVLVSILLFLFGPLVSSLISQIDMGKTATLGHPVTRALSRAIHERVARDNGVEVTFLARRRAAKGMLAHIASEHDLPESYATDIRKIVRDETGDPELPVTVIAFRGWWRSDTD